jgi:SAM-dependent methyltransferase
MLWGYLPTEGPEITDLIIDYDLESLRRLPVRKSDVLARLEEWDDRFAQRIVQRIPDRDGVLDPDAVDRLMIAVHAELQRMSEEFEHGRRMRELLVPIVDALRAAAVPPPYRIVDVGCGTGYVIRWLAAHGGLGADVELTGVDYNRAFVDTSARLAEQEGLRCSFEVANAFSLARPATVLMSTGVLHHFRGESLRAFFAQHPGSGARAFVHVDFQPTVMAVPGAVLFHLVRMSYALAHHDGILSAARAHPGAELLASARAGCPQLKVGLYGRGLGALPIPRVFHAVVGMSPEIEAPFRASLGPRLARLETLA